MSSISKRLGIPFSSFKRKATNMGLYVTNQGRKGLKRSKDEKNKKRISINKILSGDHGISSYHLKVRLIEEGIKNGTLCEECGISNLWNGKKLNLHLDHIDGDKLNNKINNLKIICPNCHSQTETYAGRNIRLKNIKNKKTYKYIKKYKNQEEYLLHKKQIWIDNQQKYIPIILNSDIDFSKHGWVNKASVLIHQRTQKVSKWMIEIMPDFYEKCFKRQNGGTVDTMDSKPIVKTT